jgi:hypothetical protein
MADPYFPSLTKKPSVGIKRGGEDPTVKSKAEDGLVLTRPRFTRIRRTFTVPYRNVPVSDRDLLLDFLTAVRVGSTQFVYVLPPDGVEVTVRFAKYPEIMDAGYVGQKSGDRGLSYSFDIELEEV